MVKREVSILEPASTSIAEIAWFLESKGLPETAKRFVNDAFDFFEKLSDPRLEYKLCSYSKWKDLGYKCIPYKKKYTIVFSETESELIICEFISSRLIHW